MSLSSVNRVCQKIIKLKPYEYAKIHAGVWPGVLAAPDHRIVDYTINYYPPLSHRLRISTMMETTMRETRRLFELTKRLRDADMVKDYLAYQNLQEKFYDAQLGLKKVGRMYHHGLYVN